MAITRTETQIQWAGANSVSVAAGSSQTSDVVTLDATAVAAQISIKADNAGTPGTADQIYVWLLQTSGDPDGTAGDEYDTTGHALLMGILDTNAEDPAIMTVPLPLPQKSFKVYADGITSPTANAITVSATVTEQRAA